MGGKAAKERRRMERLERQGDAGRASQEAKEKKKLHATKNHESQRPLTSKKNESRVSDNKITYKTTSPGSSNRTKVIPRGRKPTMAKVVMKKKVEEPKKKSFKKPKHLKRKLEQTDDDAAKALVLSELQKLEERKKLFSIHQPMKRQKTETSPSVKSKHQIPTTSPKNGKPKNATNTTSRETTMSSKTTLKSDSVVKAQVKSVKSSSNASAETNETSKPHHVIATTSIANTATKSGSKSTKKPASSGDEPNLVVELHRLRSNPPSFQNRLCQGSMRLRSSAEG